MSTILQWNCRGLISKWSEMKNFFSVLAPIIIALQETWFLPTDTYNFNLTNYSLYRYDEIFGQRRQGGVALYINNNFTHSKIDLQTNLQAVACTIYLNNRNIDVCSLYIPPNSNTDELLQQLNTLVNELHNPFLLLGDFNSHSPNWWKEQQLDYRGRKIEEFISAQNLVMLNNDQPTYYSLAHNTESSIDLSLCSPLLGTWFEWNIDNDIHDSDHYPIYLKTTFQHEGVPSFIPRWKLDKADWNKFTDICENIDMELFDDPEQGIMDITDQIKSAAKQTIPLTRPCTRTNAVPWWSPIVRHAIAKRKRAFRTYLRLRTPENLIIRNKERANARKVIRTAKRSSWQHFLSSFTHATPLSQIWTLVRRLTGKRANNSIPILRIPGSQLSISEPKQVVDAISQSFERHSSNNNYGEGFIRNAQTIFAIPPEAFLSNNEEDYNALFSLDEFKAAIASSGNTSVGPDELHYSMFRHLSDISLSSILLTLNNLWEKHTFPDSWRESIVIAIPKPGKSKNNPDHYRPISLTSCFGKLLERMVAKRISYIFEKHNMLSKYQCGFRKNHSPIDQLIRLETDIRKGFKNKTHTTAIFLDIKKAYDMVYKPAVVHKLYKFGIRGHLAYYLNNFLSGRRHFRVRCRSVFSNTQQLENGLPQGSCLSPLLFNVMINDLFHDISPGISYSLFADDSAIWCSDRDYDISISKLQVCLNKLENWSKRNGLRFSAEKSAAIIFSRTTNIQPSQELRIHNSTIPYVTQFMFLGVKLDRRLSMTHHVKYIKKKCMSRMNLFRCLTSSECGADRATLLRLYKAIVLPIIEYGAVIYSGGKETALKPLETIQNAFIRIALGAMKTSPISALQVEANIPPLHIRRMELTLRYISKIKQYPQHASHTAIGILPNIHHNYLGRSEKRSGLTIASRGKTYSREIQFNIPNITPFPCLHVAPWKLHPRSISFLFDCKKEEVSLQEIQQTFLHFQQEHRDYKFLYTDGSKGNGCTGNAIIVEGMATLKGRLPDETSVFIAELHAILIALKYIRHQNIRKACICSDSRSALVSLTNPSFKQYLQFDMVNVHENIIESGAQIIFLWIPGHSEIAGNEQADEEAKTALSLPNITNIPTNHHSITQTISQCAKLNWQNKWRNDPARTQLHDIKPKIGTWSSSNRQNRLQEKTLAKLRIGHTYLTHAFIYSQSCRPICNTCNRTLTVKHILLYCCEFRNQRDPMKLYCRTHNLPFSLPVVLGDEHPNLTNLLFIFLTETDMLSKL